MFNPKLIEQHFHGAFGVNFSNCSVDDVVFVAKKMKECGVFGIFGTHKDDMAGLCYYGLFSLQHRGQEASGMVVNDDGVCTVHKEFQDL